MTIPISLLVMHFVTDFILQDDWMALNKSKNNVALTHHVIVYSAGFFALIGLKFALITFVLHWITDYFTSRATSKLWFIQLNNKTWSDQDHYSNVYVKPHLRHWFFVMIGFDQLIHYVTLALTYRWLYGA